MNVAGVLVIAAVIFTSANLRAQNQLDLKDPKVRKMILAERKRMDCNGLYRQTQLKVDAQLKLLNKMEATAGVTPQTIANLTETTTALGQKRKEFCELYKSDPTFTKDDYFRVFGELDQRDSDVALILARITGAKSASDSLNSLKTVPPRNSTDAADVNSALTEIRKGLNQIDLRVGSAEKEIAKLQAEKAPPRVSWSVEGKPALKEAKHPEAWIRISIDRTFRDAKFAVICDRPCRAVQGQVMAPHYGGITQTDWATIPGHPEIAAFVVNAPNPMRSDFGYSACVESEDDNPVRVLDVKALIIP